VVRGIQRIDFSLVKLPVVDADVLMTATTVQIHQIPAPGTFPRCRDWLAVYAAAGKCLLETIVQKYPQRVLPLG
jgi:hypothetical protein